MPEPQRLFALSQQALIKHIEPVRAQHLVQDKRRYYFRTATQSIPVSCLDKNFEGYVFSKETLSSFLRYCTIANPGDGDGKSISYVNKIKSVFHDSQFSTIHRFFLKPEFLESFTTLLTYRAAHFWEVAKPESFNAPLYNQIHLQLEDPYNGSEVAALYGFLLDEAQAHLETFYEDDPMQEKCLALVKSIQKIAADMNYSKEDIEFLTAPASVQERIINGFVRDSLSQDFEQWMLADRTAFFILNLLTYSQWLKRVYRSGLSLPQVLPFLNALHGKVYKMDKAETIARSCTSVPRDENLLFLLALRVFREQLTQIRRHFVDRHQALEATL